MVWEFPAVSQTRYDFWNKQQYTRKGMWWFTLIGGLFGLHHLILRSPQTAILYFIANIVTLGYFYFYDLIQLSEGGGLGDEGLNTYGLGYPFGPLGIAKGMWIPESAGPAPAQQQGGGSDDETGPSSPWFFLLYALTMPLPYLATAIAGDYHNALTRFLFLIIVPFGILLATFALVYDYFILFFYPAHLLQYGTKRFFPFTLLGWHLDGHSPYITSKNTGSDCPPDNSIIGTFKGLLLLSASLIRVISPATANAIVSGVKIATDTAHNAAHKAKEVAFNTVSSAGRIGSQVGQVAMKAPAAATAALSHASSVATNPAAMIGHLHEPVAAATHAPSPPAPMQKGGGSLEKTPMDYLAFSAIAALIASGLVITFNRNSQNDSPPES